MGQRFDAARGVTAVAGALLVLLLGMISIGSTAGRFLLGGPLSHSYQLAIVTAVAANVIAAAIMPFGAASPQATR